MARFPDDALTTRSAILIFNASFTHCLEVELQCKQGTSAALSQGEAHRGLLLIEKCPRTQPCLRNRAAALHLLPRGQSLCWLTLLLPSRAITHLPPTAGGRTPGWHPLLLSPVRNIPLVYHLSHISSSVAELLLGLTHALVKHKS